MSQTEKKPIEVFFSYAHEDEKLRNELAKHLRLLVRQKIIKAWYDRDIRAGGEWKTEIEKQLNSAQIILLLVSSDFLDSDFCWGVELERAMKRHEIGEARVIPIILREADWHSAPFGMLQALPTNGKPVRNWPNRDQAFTDIVKGIRKVVEELVPTVEELVPTVEELVPTSYNIPAENPEFDKEIFISYTWRHEQSKPYVEQLEQTFQAKGIKIIRDTNAVGDYKATFKQFMQRIGRGKYVIVVISDQYLKSENCMFELVVIKNNGDWYQRIFPIILSDAKISKPLERIKYIKFWEEQIKELDEAMKGVLSANLQGFREDIDLYTEIRKTIAGLTNLLRDMNTFTPEIHSQSQFEDLLKAIERHLDE